MLGWASLFVAEYTGLYPGEVARTSHLEYSLRTLQPRKHPSSGLPPPLPQLFPRCDEFLNGARRRERATIDNGAFPVCPLVEFANGRLAEDGKVAHNLCQILARPRLLAFSKVWTASHDSRV